MARTAPALMEISAETYRALLVVRDWLAAFEPSRMVSANPGAGSVSAIDRDPELAAFIRARLGRVRLVDIALECGARFGAGRAPSKSAIHRYWKRLNASRTAIEAAAIDP
jgi:hypothetical protein